MTEQFTYTQNELKPLKIIIIALSVGITILSILAIVFANGGTSMLDSNGVIADPDRGPNVASIMRIIHIVITLSLLAIAKFVGDGILSGKIKTRTLIVGEVPTLFMRYRMSVIVRLALIEAAAMFGAIVFNLSVSATGPNPIYYLHFIPLVIFLLMAKSLYPTDFKMAEVARKYGG